MINWFIELDVHAALKVAFVICMIMYLVGIISLGFFVGILVVSVPAFWVMFAGFFVAVFDSSAGGGWF
jgi:hypothetical protein